MHTASWQIVLEGVPYDVTAYWKDGPTKVRNSIAFFGKQYFDTEDLFFSVFPFMAMIGV
jgi:cytochrome b involved in lipid metabolism